MKYADVILPLPLENTYTYRIPSDLEKAIAPGCRVLVHFGKKRYYTAIVFRVHDTANTAYETKDIHALLDATPVLRRPQLRLWEWIASYYICKLGDVYKAALPSGLKLESETSVTCNKDFKTETPLRPNERSVLDAFGIRPKLTISELEKKTGLRNVVPVVTSLMMRGAVEVGEELKKGYTPKKQSFVRLSEAYRDEAGLHKAFDALVRAAKQEALLIRYLDLSLVLNPQPTREISAKELLEHSGHAASVLDGLLRRGILERYEKEVGRLHTAVCRVRPLNLLSEAQTKAYNDIYNVFKTKDVCLLHGVTSSGKTEIYAHLASDVIGNGRQVLFLMPEIAITTQITGRLSKLFGDKLLVYHSGFSDNERVEVWNKLLHDGSPMLVLGVRSSLFLPFKDLGLIVVDEEHENTYKQQDPAPRYHARNVAVILANMHGGKTLLASATPSVDAYYNALTGKYGLVKLSVRYGEYLMPEIISVDTKELKRKKIMKDTLFSPILIQKMNEALERGEQIILFRNRRGFAPMMECKSCGWTPHCMNCDVSLTYHKRQNRLVCHYCGYIAPLPRECPQCRHTDLKMLGFGTEKIEEEVGSLFPSVTVGRLDFDSAHTRMACERILANFDNGRIRILIGTQMLSKGLDFGNVTVVGILNADSLMNFPDFRAHERAYQLMVQVSGRCGRREKRGVVVIQTSQAEHPVIRMVEAYQYEEMVNLQLGERSMFRYPPYFRLIFIILRSRNEGVLQEMSTLYADKLRVRLGERVVGPVMPPVTRIQTFHIRKILLKIEVTAATSPVRELLEEVYADMQRYTSFKKLLVYYDVDPV
ncbi:MAG: primosomal protein N' [Tannerellaceae bacterium]|nr:primosomal protein N' [Tannerellaceae bacterium]